MTEIFDNREIATMMMCLESYVTMPECPETEGIKNELNEIIRKLHSVLDMAAE